MTYDPAECAYKDMCGQCIHPQCRNYHRGSHERLDDGDKQGKPLIRYYVWNWRKRRAFQTDTPTEAMRQAAQDMLRNFYRIWGITPDEVEYMDLFFDGSRAMAPYHMVAKARGRKIYLQ